VGNATGLRQNLVGGTFDTESDGGVLNLEPGMNDAYCFASLSFVQGNAFHVAQIQSTWSMQQEYKTACNPYENYAQYNHFRLIFETDKFGTMATAIEVSLGDLPMRCALDNLGVRGSLLGDQHDTPACPNDCSIVGPVANQEVHCSRGAPCCVA